MTNTQGFVRLSAPPQALLEQLGPLAALPGTWSGSKGWNLIAVPHKNDFTLLVRPYIETITFEPIGALVPNRAANETMLIPGLAYQLRIADAETNEAMHMENGLWLLLRDPASPTAAQIARQSSVPHGDSLLALGTSTVASGRPVIPILDSLPHTGAGAPPGYTDPYLTPIQGFNKKNPNEALDQVLGQQAAAGQTVASTTTIHVSTTPPGGIVNIPFIAHNADARHFACTCWIETVQDSAGAYFEQLQYSQQTDLYFLPRFDDPSRLILWPHINVNTLVKQ